MSGMVRFCPFYLLFYHLVIPYVPLGREPIERIIRADIMTSKPREVQENDRHYKYQYKS